MCNNIPGNLNHFDAIVNGILKVFWGVYRITVFFFSMFCELIMIIFDEELLSARVA